MSVKKSCPRTSNKNNVSLLSLSVGSLDVVVGRGRAAGLGLSSTTSGLPSSVASEKYTKTSDIRDSFIFLRRTLRRENNIF